MWLMPKITVIASGRAIEKPMKEPKVTMYRIVIDQVCLLRKMPNCWAMLSFMVPNAVSRITSSVLTTISGMASHMFSRPRPVGFGKYRYRPRPAGTKDKV